MGIDTSAFRNIMKGHKVSDDVRKRISATMKARKLGGLRVGSGRGKKGWYKGIHCDSSWELAFVVYHIEHNLHIERCTEVRHYTFNGEQHKYYPDFITDAGVIEIKGIRIDDKTRAKLLANPDVILIDHNAIWGTLSKLRCC